MTNVSLRIGACSMDMQVREAEDGITRVELKGRFDIAGAQEVDLRFSAIAGSAKALVVDMAQVSFLASMGVRTLMLSAKTMIRRKAIMAVCAADQNVEKVLRSTGFDEIIDLYPDFAAASAALAKPKE